MKESKIAIGNYQVGHPGARCCWRLAKGFSLGNINKKPIVADRSLISSPQENAGAY